MSGVASPELQPDFEVEVLLEKNLLPLESTCDECGKPTNQVVSVYVECSRVTIVPPRSRTNLLMTALLWPVVAFFLYYWGQQRRLARERGTDRIYRLPVRICDACLERKEELPKLLAHTPLYARLLSKYPQAKIRW